MNQITRSQFSEIKAHFGKLKAELNREKLAIFAADVQFFLERANYSGSPDTVSHAEWAELARSVESTQRVAELAAKSGQTSEYSRYTANAVAGLPDGHPDSKSQSLIELQKKLHSNSALYHELKDSLGGFTSEELRREFKL